MTTEIELLPLYAELQGHPKIEIIKHYARANVARAIAAKDAEIDTLRTRLEDTVRDSINKIEALRAEVEQLAASEKTCRRIANEKTLEAMALREALAALKAENARLREALKDADNELDWLDEEMDTCDHSVGVCSCDYWDMRRKMKAALSKETKA